jgi:hypothetical protein
MRKRLLEEMGKGGQDRPTGAEAATATATVVDSPDVTAEELERAAYEQVATSRPGRRGRRLRRNVTEAPDVEAEVAASSPNQRSCGSCGSGPGWHPGSCAECAAYVAAQDGKRGT